MCYTSPYSHYENNIVGQLEDKNRWIKIAQCECPSCYINIYRLRTLLNTVDKNRITRRQTNKISLLSTILHCDTLHTNIRVAAYKCLQSIGINDINIVNLADV